MAEQKMRISNAIEVDLSQYVPPTAAEAEIKIGIKPSSGRVLIYTPAQTDPIEFSATSDTHKIPLRGSKIYLQALAGAEEWSIALVGYRDSI